MKLFALLIAAALLIASHAPAQTKNVTKTISTNGLVENLVVPSGKTLTINAGGSIVNNGTATGFTASAVWGGITGTLSSQTDLQTALDAKAPLASPIFTGTLSAASISLSGSLATGSGNIETTAGNISTGLGIISGNGSGITTLNASNISSGTLAAARLPASGVTAGSYTAANLTVDAYGRITAAADGSGPAPDSNVHPDVSPVFWFDANQVTTGDRPANGAAVSSWDDLMSATNVTQATSTARPTYIERHEINGKPCVRFDGGDLLSRTNLSTSATSGHTIVVVGRVPETNANFQFFVSGSADNGGTATWFGWQANRVPTRMDASGSTSNVNLSSPNFDKISVMAYRVNSSTRDFWVGQTKVKSSATGTLPTTIQFSHLGSYNNGGYNLVGDIFEVIAWASPLTDDQLAEVVASLEDKWNCEHEMLVIDGNSLFTGANGGNGLANLIRPVMGRQWYVTSYAVTGQTTAQARSDFATQIAPFCGPRLDGRKNLLLFTEFRNHLAASGISYATAWEEYQAYINDGTTAGAHVIATTMIPATTGMPTNNWTEANRVQGNADILATYTTPSRVWDWASTAYSTAWLTGGDGIHLTAGRGEPDAARAFLAWLQSVGLYR